jgi:hypothetical protein
MHGIITKVQDRFLLADDGGVLGMQANGKYQVTALFNEDPLLLWSSNEGLDFGYIKAGKFLDCLSNY